MTNQSTTREKLFEAASGPWSNLSATCCNQMDTAFKTAEPAMQALTRVQLEWAQLGLSRARAWAAVAGDLSRCRGPADIATLQLNFWQEAQQAYAHSWQRILAASSALAQQGRVIAAPATTPRDVLKVSDTAPEDRKRQAA